MRGGESVLEAEEPVAVAGEEPRLGDARHLSHHPGHVGGGHLGQALPPGPGAGQVHGRHGLVGKEAIADVPRGQRRGRLDRIGREVDAVVLLVAGEDSLEDADGVRNGRLPDQHRREAALQRRVPLDVLSVLVVGGGADAGELAARQARLELVGGVLRALAGGAGAHDRVDLVDEDHHAPLGAPHLVLDAAELLGEGAAQLGAGEHAGHVELHQHAAGSPWASIRCATPSTMAVLPTPASPTRSGLLVRRLPRTSRVCSTSHLPPHQRVEAAGGGELGEVAAQLGEPGELGRVERVGGAGAGPRRSRSRRGAARAGRRAGGEVERARLAARSSSLGSSASRSGRRRLARARAAGRREGGAGAGARLAGWGTRRSRRGIPAV